LISDSLAGATALPGSDRRPAAASLSSRAAWLIAAAVLLAYALTLARYGVNFPGADDYAQILNIPFNFAHASTLRAKAANLVALAVEHRIATLRLATLAQAYLFGGVDFRGLMVFGSALLLVAGWLLVSTVDRDSRPRFAAVAAALLLSPANFEGSLWATGALQHFGVTCYAFASLYCLSRPGLGRQLGALALALAAIGTSAGGLMAFPAAVLLLCLERRWRGALAWGLVGVALFAVYFIGYEAPPYQGSLATYFRDPLGLLRFFFMTIGAIGIEPPLALVVGVVVCLFWAGMIGTRRIASLPPVWIAWAAFLALSLAAIAWGRAGFGPIGAVLSRYRVYSEMALLVSLAAALSQLPTPTRLRWLWVALLAALACFFLSWRHELPGIERLFIARQAQLDYYVAEGHSVPNDSPPPAYRDPSLLAAKELGVYDASRVAREPRELVAEPRALQAESSPVVRIDRPVAGRRALMLSGNGPEQGSDAAVWLDNGGTKYRAALEAAPLAPLALGRRTGFLWGVYALKGLPRGHYRVGAGVDDPARPSVWWTDYWIDVE